MLVPQTFLILIKNLFRITSYYLIPRFVGNNHQYNIDLSNYKLEILPAAHIPIYLPNGNLHGFYVRLSNHEENRSVGPRKHQFH